MAENQKNTQQPEKKKISRLKIAFIIVALLLALLILKLFLILTARPTISVDYVAELNRITKPADYDPNKNAAFVYQKAFDSYVSIPPEIDYCWTNWPGDMNDTELNILTQWLASNNETLSYLKLGSDKPYCWTELSYPDSNLLHISTEFDYVSLRKAILALDWHAKYEASKGQFNDAFDKIMSSYRIGSHFTGRKRMVDQVVGMALNSISVNDAFVILDRAHIDPETLEHFQQRFQEESCKNELDFQSEKLRAYDFIQHVFTDNGRGNGNLIPGRFAKLTIHEHFVYYVSPKNGTFIEQLREVKERYTFYANMIWFAFTGPDRKQTTAMTDKLYSYCDKIKSQTPWQLHSKHTHLKKQIEDIVNNNYVLETIYYFDLTMLIRSHQRFKSGESALITTIAILRYKENKGHYPENLEELVSAGYLKELPMDPFSDNPLVYRRTQDNFTLYSLGYDFVDDGGNLKKQSKYGLGYDLVFWPVKRPERVENR